MTVYVVQDQNEVDNKGKLKPKFDFSDAERFGELVFLLKPNASPFDLPPVLERLHKMLSKFSDKDFLLLTGSPVLIGISTAIAADYNFGRVNMLQWSGAKRKYIPVYSPEDIFKSPEGTKRLLGKII